MAHIRIFRHYVHTPYLVISLIEAVLLCAVAYLGYYSRHLQLPDLQWHLLPAGTFALVMLTMMWAMGVYESRIREGFVAMMLRTAVAMFLLGVLVFAAFSYATPYLFMDRSVLFLTVCEGYLILTIWRWFAYRLIDDESLKTRVLVLGTGNRAAKIASRMRRRSDQRAFQLLGYLAVEQRETHPVEDFGGRVLAPSDSLPELCRKLDVEEIVVALDERRRNQDASGGLPIEDLLQCRMSGVRICDVQQFIEREAGKVDVDLLRTGWLVFSEGFVMSGPRRVVKRGFDVTVSLVMLLLFLPIMLATTLIVRLESSGPAIYRQRRIGLDGKPFELLKFRSMRDVDTDDAPRWTAQSDPRITPFGRFIRKTRLDELPQLINVLKGDMSFVGPRPERPFFVRQLVGKLPYYEQRHRIKPGITGWAQLCYPYGASVEDAKEKLQYDLYYLKNHSLLLDLIILIQTVEVVLVGKGAR